MPAVAGPFYLAYVANENIPFDPVAHAVMDEYVFSWKRTLSETDKPTLELEMRNPHIGLLNSSRLQWAWLSWLNPTTSVVEPLFLGRIVGNPNNAFAEVIKVQFVSWPSDYFKKRQTVAETLKVAPFWDEVFVSVEKSDDPDTILESRSELWCVDPITLKVTAEDILDSSDGNVDITADDHFYDALVMRDGDAPLTAVLIDATVSWTQTGRGFIDMGSQIINTFAGDGIINEWPKPLTSLGSGWTVKSGLAVDNSHTAQIITGTVSSSWTNPEKEHSDGDTLSVNWSLTAPGPLPGMQSVTLTSKSQTGFLDPFAVDGDGDPSPTNKPASFSATYAYVPPWTVVTSLILRYDLSRQRTERVRILMKADLQAVINDPLVGQNSEVITMTGRDVGVPLVNLLDWTTVSDTNVELDQIIYPDDPTLPGGRSAQVAVAAGHAGVEEPTFSDIPGAITVDGTVQWASLGTSNPTEGAQDWTGLTNYNPGAIILPRYPLWADLGDVIKFGLMQFPPVGTPISLGETLKVGDDFQVCTLDGTIGAGDATAVLTSIGPALPDGKTYYMTPNGGMSGPLYVTPSFGSHTEVNDSVNDNGIKWVSIGPGDIPAGGTPGNVWARSYFPSTRGKQSLEYLMAIGRAHIRKRARAVELEFECPFELGVGITCRKTVTLHDSRIPGGLALGKVIRAELSANGDTGEVKFHGTIGCAVGHDNAVTEVPGTPVYAATGYMQSGYQKEVDSIIVLPGLVDVGYTPPIDAPNDDGLVLPLDKTQITLSEAIRGSLAEQALAVSSALGSMAKAAQIAQRPVGSISQSILNQQTQTRLSANSVAFELSRHPIYYAATLKPVVNGPFWDSYVIETEMVTLPKGIDLEGTSTVDESSDVGGTGHVFPKTVTASVSEFAVATSTNSVSGGAPSTISASVKEDATATSSSSSGSTALDPPAGYSSSQLIFEDTFSGASLDSSKWIPNIADQFGIWRRDVTAPYSAANAGSFDAEYFDPAQVVTGSGLKITATRSTLFSGYSWKSGCICTHGKFTFAGGYAQCRMKQPDCTTGAWPGFWMLEGGGEIDVQEGGYIHGATSPNNVLAVNLHTSGNSQNLLNQVDLSAGYHVYGMEYVPGVSVKMYLDGVLQHTYTSNVPTGPMTILINLQMAQLTTGWHTVVSGSTPTSLEMDVSCVQVYHL